MSVETATARRGLEVPAAEASRPDWRRSALWVGAITVVGILLRFTTLGLQSYHHDEVITAVRVLPGSFTHMLSEVGSSESTPPLYYVLAWAMAKIFGLGEVSLRSLSAFFGAATIPVAYLIGRELSSRRAGLIAAALVAVNPMLIWYSQEARAYALMVLLCGLSLLFFIRVLRDARSGDITLWALCSALALASHYYAGFPIAIEAAWMLAGAPRARRRAVGLGIAGVGVAGIALAPLLLHQVSFHHTDWIAGAPILGRLKDSGVAFLAGETGKLIGEPSQDGYAVLPALGLLIAFAAGWKRIPNRRSALVVLAVGLGSVALSLLAAAGGQDFVLARNLLPALVPLLVAAAIAMAGMRRAGTWLAVGLCTYWVAFAVQVNRTADLQRPDWDGVAAELGPAKARRAIVTWTLGVAPLEYYLHDGSHKTRAGTPVRAREVDVISDAGAPPPRAVPSPAFRRIEVIHQEGLTIARFRAPRTVGLGFRKLIHLNTGFHSNLLLVARAVAGGPGSTAPGRPFSTPQKTPGRPPGGPLSPG